MGEKYESGDWYRAPLWYDIIFDGDTEEEADFLEALRVKYGRSQGRSVFEPACGTGRILIELAARGWTGHGLDAEPAMVEFAGLRAQQQHVHKRVKIWCDRMEQFTLPGELRYDLAFTLLSSFKYLTEEKQVTAFLQGVSNALKPGGIFVLGTHLTDYQRNRPEHERWVGERDGIHVTCNTRTWPANQTTRLELMRNRLRVTQDGDHAARVETRWSVRSYDVQELMASITKAPNLKHVATYDFDYEIDSPSCNLENLGDTVVLVLRKSPV